MTTKSAPKKEEESKCTNKPDARAKSKPKYMNSQISLLSAPCTAHHVLQYFPRPLASKFFRKWAGDTAMSGAP
jgi:hypothetical protein